MLVTTICGGFLMLMVFKNWLYKFKSLMFQIHYQSLKSVTIIRHQHRCGQLPELKPLLQDFVAFLCIFPILLAFDAFHFSAVQQAFYFQNLNSLFQQLDLRKDFKMICRSLIELWSQSELFRIISKPNLSYSPQRRQNNFSLHH